MIADNKIPDGVLIDEEDREMLESMGKWYIDSNGYCRINKTISINGKIKWIARKIHRVVMGEPKNFVIDHINGNRLDNRKQNLRLVTNQENVWNQTKRKGYYYDSRSKSKNWRVRISVNNKRISIGRYDTEEEARNAYLEARNKYHNIPERK